MNRTLLVAWMAVAVVGCGAGDGGEEAARTSTALISTVPNEVDRVYVGDNHVVTTDGRPEPAGIFDATPGADLTIRLAPTAGVDPVNLQLYRVLPDRSLEFVQASKGALAAIDLHATAGGPFLVAASTVATPGFLTLTVSCENHSGACTPLAQPADVCDGAATPACDQGLFCQHPVGACNALAARGSCARVPRACSMVLKPVCGCDQRTYGNACVAANAGVSLAAEGPCPN